MNIKKTIAKFVIFGSLLTPFMGQAFFDMEEAIRGVIAIAGTTSGMVVGAVGGGVTKFTGGSVIKGAFAGGVAGAVVGGIASYSMYVGLSKIIEWKSQKKLIKNLVKN